MLMQAEGAISGPIRRRIGLRISWCPALRAQQDDLDPLGLLLRRATIPHERLQTQTVGRSDDDGSSGSDASDSLAIGWAIPQGFERRDLIHSCLIL